MLQNLFREFLTVYSSGLLTLKSGVSLRVRLSEGPRRHTALSQSSPSHRPLTGKYRRLSVTCWGRGLTRTAAVDWSRAARDRPEMHQEDQRSLRHPAPATAAVADCDVLPWCHTKVIMHLSGAGARKASLSMGGSRQVLGESGVKSNCNGGDSSRPVT